MDDLLAALLCLPFLIGPLILLTIILVKRIQTFHSCR